jgi:hypothetical protein
LPLPLPLPLQHIIRIALTARFGCFFIYKAEILVVQHWSKKILAIVGRRQFLFNDKTNVDSN